MTRREETKAVVLAAAAALASEQDGMALEAVGTYEHAIDRVRKLLAMQSIEEHQQAAERHRELAETEPAERATHLRIARAHERSVEELYRYPATTFHQDPAVLIDALNAAIAVAADLVGQLADLRVEAGAT